MNSPTETEIKLQDAATQLQLAVDNMNDEDVFRSCINSFISFARSVTMVMEKETRKNPELLAWYKSKTEEFSKDPVMKFFNEQRVHTVHLGNVKPKSHIIPLRNVAAGGEAADQPTMRLWIFDNAHEYVPGETGNVFRMCERYLAILVFEFYQVKQLMAVANRMFL